MSEEDKDSKTYEPTQKKLQDAKKKGQTTRSKELSNFVTLLISSLIFLFFAYGDGEAFKNWFLTSFKFERRHLYEMPDLLDKVKDSFFDASMLIMAFLIVVTIVAVLGNLLVGGWIFAPKNAVPKFEKVNPLKGIKRMFSLKTLVELIKSIVKMVILAAISYWFVVAYKDEILNLSLQTVDVVGVYVLETSALFFALVSLALIVVVLIDAPYQFYEHKKNLMMSHDEIKRENKEQNGDPHLKGKQRQLQRQMASGRMLDEVPKADVIVTNPTHYSVALRYDEQKHNAPIVVASGVDKLAMKIREVGKEHNVEIVESPELARSLYRYVDVGSVIPDSLFMAVAKLITIIREIDDIAVSEREKALRVIEDITVPQEMKYSGE
ncbi:flagellar biosynthesis protein FlhB [Alteromonas macleodii]|uniref:flagellar biosynthesis protein FlhB n=1 Tax=Alteromonas macleodii TaxID=28108 RepID=UPI003140294A